ncbi:ParA family protein [Brachybacterium kimchii]|uniref:ParA family protein n=1 Tax=Brachybacterium kimchii TaxID=2942909 RepID=A0ABY4N7C7_9MICO|nr:ParA family protein [Brachybacterium kimchii]UQN30452.1 ParA family protein [Brachybacterium kimchii]
MRIAVISTKGGVGKTTCAMHLAQALSSLGTVEVFDMDPQGSATDWAYRAEDSGDPLDFRVNPSNTRELSHLERAQTADHLVIDTPPGLPDVILASARVADAVIIPTEHSGLDMAQVWKLIEALPDVPFGVLISKSNPRTISYRQAVAELQSHDVPLFATDVRRSERVKESFARTVRSERLFGYDSVLDELIRALGVRLRPATRERKESR